MKDCNCKVILYFQPKKLGLRSIRGNRKILDLGNFSKYDPFIIRDVSFEVNELLSCIAIKNIFIMLHHS